MALPFLKQKQIAGLIIKKRASDSGVSTEAPEAQEDSPNQGLESCAAELVSAIEAKDAKAVAAALRSAFEILESEPHEESAQMPEQAGE